MPGEGIPGEPRVGDRTPDPTSLISIAAPGFKGNTGREGNERGEPEALWGSQVAEVQASFPGEKKAHGETGPDPTCLN